jgi:transposase
MEPIMAPVWYDAAYSYPLHAYSAHRKERGASMSLRSPLGYAIPEETIRVARAAFPKSTLVMQVRDELGPLYTNAQFAALFSDTGQPAEDPARLALVLVLQFLEGLSDRQAADAVRDRIAWKYALALELTDPGFDASVLSEFRDRLIASQAEQLLLDSMLTQLQQRGLLKARGRQRTDSTHVLAAIRTLNRLTCVGETMRQALNALAGAAPDWLTSHVPADWFDRYGRRLDDARLPREKTARTALGAAIGSDGFWLLTLLDHPDTPPDLWGLPAVQILRRIWCQQYYAPQPDAPVRWRGDDDTPPPGQLIHSPYDVEARYSTKREMTWVGYKTHLTETCDDDTPHVITHVATTPGTIPDDTMTATIHADLAAKQLLPAEHLVDAGYTGAQLLVESRSDHQIDLLGPVVPDPSWQARAGEGYDVASFQIDWDAQVVSCPQGKRSCYWRPQVDASGRAEVQVRFAATDCRSCVARSQCTKAKATPRSMTLLAQESFLAMQSARQRQTTPEFKSAYAKRAGCESTVSQGVRAFDLRRARYRGLAKTQLQQILTAIAMTLVRVIAWFEEPKPASPRQGRFAALAPTG